MADNVKPVKIPELNRENLAKESASLDADMKAVKAIRPYASVDLKKTEPRLLAIAANLEAILEKKKEVAALPAPIAQIEKGMEDIAYYAKLDADIISFVSLLDKAKRYEEAMVAIDLLRNGLLELDYGVPMSSAKAVAEIIDHEKACIYAHKGEDAIASHKVALEPEEMEAYAKLAEGLGTQIDGEKSRHYHMDKSLGFRYDAATRKFVDHCDTQEDFLAMLACDGELSKTDIELSETTQARKAEFARAIAYSFNSLSRAAFDGDDFDNALFYFEHRDYIDPAVVIESAYLLPDETEFHYAFEIAKAKRNNDDDFYEYTKTKVEPLIAQDEFTIGVFGRLMAAEDLSESQFELILATLRKVNFETAILVFGSAMEVGLSEEKQFAVITMLSREKKKRGDLEKMAKPLVNIRAQIAVSQKPEFDALVAGLLRSPRAKKIGIKSTNVAVHELFGETEETICPPLGKRCPSTKVKYWDLMTKFCYVCFAIVLPLLACVAGAVVLLMLDIQPPLLKHLLPIAPVVVAMIFWLAAIQQRFGFDERPSEKWGVFFGIVGILIGGFGLVFFIKPDLLPFIAPYCYLILSVSVCCGFSALLMKQRKTGVRIVLTLPLVAIWIASAVFMVLDLMNGLI